MLKTVHWFIVRLTTKPSLYWWQWRPFCSSSGSGGQTPSGAVTSTQGSAFSGRPQRGQGRAFGSCPAVWPHVPCWDGWNLFGYFSHPFGWVLNSLKKEKEKKKKKPQSWTSPLSASQYSPQSPGPEIHTGWHSGPCLLLAAPLALDRACSVLPWVSPPLQSERWCLLPRSTALQSCSGMRRILQLALGWLGVCFEGRKWPSKNPWALPPARGQCVSFPWGGQGGPGRVPDL